MQKHILAAAEAELEHVLLLQLVVPLGINALVVQVGAVARAQVDDVGLHSTPHGSVSPGVFHQPGQGTTQKNLLSATQ